MYGRLKSNAAAYSAFLTVANRLPARVVYRPPYFQVRGLLEQAESGEDIGPQLSRSTGQHPSHRDRRVPHYRDLDLGIRPDEIEPQHVHEVLSRFPYLEKSEVMESPESFVSDEQDTRTLTSGTTSRVDRPRGQGVQECLSRIRGSRILSPPLGQGRVCEKCQGGTDGGRGSQEG